MALEVDNPNARIEDIEIEEDEIADRANGGDDRRFKSFDEVKAAELAVRDPIKAALRMPLDASFLKRCREVLQQEFDSLIAAPDINALSGIEKSFHNTNVRQKEAMRTCSPVIFEQFVFEILALSHGEIADIIENYTPELNDDTKRRFKTAVHFMVMKGFNHINGLLNANDVNSEIKKAVNLNHVKQSWNLRIIDYFYNYNLINRIDDANQNIPEISANRNNNIIRNLLNNNNNNNINNGMNEALVPVLPNLTSTPFNGLNNDNLAMSINYDSIDQVTFLNYVNNERIITDKSICIKLIENYAKTYNLGYQIIKKSINQIKNATNNLTIRNTMENVSKFHESSGAIAANITLASSM